MKETDNLMGGILEDYSHLIAKNKQDFDEKFGKYLPKNEDDEWSTDLFIYEIYRKYSLLANHL